jgi:tetratricopeptide (TPR) repeat protein
MEENSKASHSHQKRTEDPIPAVAGVRIETVVILVVAAFVVGLMVGAILALLKSSPSPGSEAMSSSWKRNASPVGGFEPSRDIQMQTTLAQKDPENPEVWAMLGNLFSRDKIHDKAIEAYKKALELQRGNADTLVRLGNAYFDSEDYEAAITTYTEALAIDPSNADVLTDLGVAYRRVNRPEKALNAFRKATDIDSMHASSRYNQGVVLFHDLNDKEGAIKAWQAFLQIEPTGERAEKVRQMLDVLKAMPPSQNLSE